MFSHTSLNQLVIPTFETHATDKPRNALYQSHEVTVLLDIRAQAH